ncbi:MAG TPA: hypothetical protein VKW09_13085 [bacterium]|nr:hypothetical protein [bacterium]
MLQLRHAPFRPALEAIAHTLVYDAAIVGDLSLPTQLIASVATPTLLIAGEQSWPFLRAAARAVADALPNGRHCILTGQTHTINPSVTSTALEEFFIDNPCGRAPEIG